MSLRKLKKLFGSLDLNSVKNVINKTKRGINLLKDVDSIADKYNIEVVKRLTDKLLASKNLKKLETGLEVGSRVIGGIEQSRKSGFFNRPPQGFQDHATLNKEGEKYALDKRRSVLEKDRIQSHPVKEFSPEEEKQLAENIVRNIK